MAYYEVKGMLGKVLALLDSNSFIGKMCCACGVAATEEITYKPLGDNVIHMCEYCYGYLSKEVPGCQCAECLRHHSFKNVKIGDKLCLTEFPGIALHAVLVGCKYTNSIPNLVEIGEIYNEVKYPAIRSELTFVINEVTAIRCNGEH